MMFRSDLLINDTGRKKQGRKVELLFRFMQLIGVLHQMCDYFTYCQSLNLFNHFSTHFSNEIHVSKSYENDINNDFFLLLKMQG